MAELLRLGPLGQMPNVSTYTILTLGFPIEAGSEQHVFSELKNAANKITLAYPWLAGQVVVKEKSAASSGTFSIVEYPPHQREAKFVRFKDCTADLESFEDIVKRKAPIALLNGDIVSPAVGFANFYPDEVIKPVVYMQANFVKGGLLLTVCTHHCVMDANGNEQFISQFASLLRGDELSPTDIEWGNANQDTIITAMGPNNESYDELDRFRAPSSLGNPPGDWPPSSAEDSWRCFRFSKAKVAELKELGSKYCKEEGVEYISSNDAVTAFIWQRFMIARIKLGLPIEGESTLIRAINARAKARPPIPKAYMGHVILCGNAAVPMASFIDPTLYHPVHELRRSLQDIGHNQIASFFHQLQTQKDRTVFNYGAKMDPQNDLMITSFASQKLYHTSFGRDLAQPAFVRRPRLPDALGLLYLMPVTREGDYDLLSCMTDEEYEELLDDDTWKTYAELIK